MTAFTVFTFTNLLPLEPTEDNVRVVKMRGLIGCVVGCVVFTYLALKLAGVGWFST